VKTLPEAIETGDGPSALAVLTATTSLADSVREIAHAAAPRVDVDHPPVPAHVHPWQALGAAASLSTLLRRDALLPVAQAAWYLTLAPRIGAHREHEARVVGEEVHLAKSLLLEIRAGNATAATRLFNGLLSRKERTLLGDMFFQGAAEDSASSGHKLPIAVLGWLLARHVGWSRLPALTMWPAVHHVAMPPKDASVFAVVAHAVGKGALDLETASRHLGHVRGETAALRAALRGERAEEAAGAAVVALKSGAGGDAILDEVSRHLSAAGVGGDAESALHALSFAHAARFVLGFSKSGHRLLPAIAAAAVASGVRASDPDWPGAARVQDRAAALNELGLAVEMGDRDEALSLLRGLLDSGVDPDELVSSLAREASKEDAHATGGHSLIFAHAAIQEYRHSNSPDRWMALAALVSWLSALPHHREVLERLGAFA
jgi:hypothetical protein